MERHRREALTSAMCAQCPTLAACPTCRSGQTCQLSIPTSCADCPTNSCVNDPNHRSPSVNTSKAQIGGALGGIIIAASLLALVYLLCRARQRKAEVSERSARVERKIRVAKQKFIPGRSEKGLPLRGQAGDEGDNSRDASPFVERETFSNIEIDDLVVANDKVELTELRDDGLIAHRKPPSSSVHTTSAEHSNAKRRSTGAATHLSRITEAVEDDDSVYHKTGKCASQLSLRKGGRRGPLLSTTSATSSPRPGSIQQWKQSEQTSIDFPKDPFSDELASETSTLGSGSFARYSLAANSITASEKQLRSLIEPLAPVHRNFGSPLVDLRGKDQPKKSQLFDPPNHSPLLAVIRPPDRPQRTPDLNLSLTATTLQTETKIVDSHATASDAITRKRYTDRTFSPSAASSVLFPDYYFINQSPAAASSNLHHSGTEEVYKANGIPPLPSDKGLRSDNTGEERRLSTLTTDSGSLSYVFSAPKIITPIDRGGAQRLQLKQGKAQLILGPTPMKERTIEGEKDLAKSASRQEDHGRLRASEESMISSSLGLALTISAVSTGKRSKVRDGHGLRPSSSISADSLGLPFVDSRHRSLDHPLDRSPTDACPRDSLASMASAAGWNEEEEDQVLTIQSQQNNVRVGTSTIVSSSIFDDIPIRLPDSMTR